MLLGERVDNRLQIRLVPRLVVGEHVPIGVHQLGRRGFRIEPVGTFLREQARDEILCLDLIAARRPQYIAPSRQIGPSCPTGGLGIGSDHRDSRFDQVRPVFNRFRVAFADQKHNRRSVRSTVIRKPALPIRWQQPRFLADGINVISEPKGDNIGFQPVDNCPSLLA